MVCSDVLGPEGCASCTPGCLAEEQYAQTLDACSQEAPENDGAVTVSGSEAMFAYVTLNDEMLAHQHLVVDNCKSDMDAIMCASTEFIDSCFDANGNRRADVANEFILVDDNSDLEWQNAHSVQLELIDDANLCRHYEAIDLFTTFARSELSSGDIIYFVSHRASGDANQHRWRLSCADSGDNSQDSADNEEEMENFQCENLQSEAECSADGACQWTSNQCFNKRLSCTEAPIRIPFGNATVVTDGVEKQLDYQICQDNSGTLGEGVVKFPCRWFFMDLGEGECVDERGLVFISNSTIEHLAIRIQEIYHREVFEESRSWESTNVNDQTYPVAEYQPPIIEQKNGLDNPALEIKGPGGVANSANPMNEARLQRLVRVVIYIHDEFGNATLCNPNQAQHCPWEMASSGDNREMTVNYQCQESLKANPVCQKQKGPQNVESNDEGVVTSVSAFLIEPLRDAFNKFFDEKPHWQFALPTLVRAFFHDAVMVNASETSAHGCLKWVIQANVDSCNSAHKNLVAALDLMEELRPIFNEIITTDNFTIPFDEENPLQLSDPDLLVFMAACAVDRAMPIEVYDGFDSHRHYLSARMGWGRPNRGQNECSAETAARAMCARAPEVKSPSTSINWEMRLPPNHDEIIKKMMRDGLTAKDVVAMMGAHTFGFHRDFRWGPSDCLHSGPWTTTPDVFNNEYFHQLMRIFNQFTSKQEADDRILVRDVTNRVCSVFDNEQSTDQGWTSATDWCQLCGAGSPKIDSITGCESKFCPDPEAACTPDNTRGDCKKTFDSQLLMLDTDLAMILTGKEGTSDFTGNQFLPFVQTFAEHQVEFFDAFQAAFIKWSDLGQKNINYHTPGEGASLVDTNPITRGPSISPSVSPTMAPTQPTEAPTVAPSISLSPTTSPSTSQPSAKPHAGPTLSPSTTPSVSQVDSQDLIEMADTQDLCYYWDTRTVQPARGTRVESQEFCFHHINSDSPSSGSQCEFAGSTTPLLLGSEDNGSIRLEWEDCALWCVTTDGCLAFSYSGDSSKFLCEFYSDYPDMALTYSHRSDTTCWVKQADAGMGVLESPGVLFRGRGKCANGGGNPLAVDMLGSEVVGSSAVNSVRECEQACRMYNTAEAQCFAISFARSTRCDLHLQLPTLSAPSTRNTGTASHSQIFCYEVYYSGSDTPASGSQ